MQTEMSRALQSYIDKLPALPTSVAKVMEICNDPASSPADLSKVISLDPVLMGRIMKLINSAYYGLENRVTSLVRAIIMLGFNTVKNLALSTAILGTVGKTRSQALNMEKFWMHSLSVGVTAKLIARKKGEPTRDLEEFFIAGLLHDIGKIAFNNKVPGEYSRALAYTEKECVSLLQAEEHELSITHTEVGGMIATAWQLGENLSYAITHHHGTYDGPHQVLVNSVCAANYFSNTIDPGFSGELYPDTQDREAFSTLQVNLDELQGMEAEIRAAIERARIFLRLAD